MMFKLVANPKADGPKITTTAELAAYLLDTDYGDMLPGVFVIMALPKQVITDLDEDSVGYLLAMVNEVPFKGDDKMVLSSRVALLNHIHHVFSTAKGGGDYFKLSQCRNAGVFAVNGVSYTTILDNLWRQAFHSSEDVQDIQDQLKMIGTYLVRKRSQAQNELTMFTEANSIKRFKLDKQRGIEANQLATMIKNRGNGNESDSSKKGPGGSGGSGGNSGFGPGGGGHLGEAF